MKNAKLMFATFAEISVLSVAFAKANEENVADAKMMASDTALAQKHFKATNETDLKRKRRSSQKCTTPTFIL